MYGKFMLDFLPSYKGKDDHITEFLVEIFPKYLEDLEKRLQENDTKYLLADHMTLADIAVMSHFFKFAFNEAYEHQLIFQAQIQGYEYTWRWCQ